MNVGIFHLKRPLLKNRDGNIITRDLNILYHYHNRLTGCCFDGSRHHESPTFDINPIVDRIGGGDAFVAGYIYGALHFGSDDAQMLAFATAASALKHTIEGDFNAVSVAEVEQIAGGDTSGRLLR